MIREKPKTKTELKTEVLPVRIISILAVLALVAVSLVHIRRTEVKVRYGIRRVEARSAACRRQLANQQITLAELTSPEVVRLRARAMSLGLIDSGHTARYVALR